MGGGGGGGVRKQGKVPQWRGSEEVGESSSVEKQRPECNFTCETSNGLHAHPEAMFLLPLHIQFLGKSSLLCPDSMFLLKCSYFCCFSGISLCSDAPVICYWISGQRAVQSKWPCLKNIHAVPKGNQCQQRCFSLSHLPTPGNSFLEEKLTLTVLATITFKIRLKCIVTATCSHTEKSTPKHQGLQTLVEPQPSSGHRAQHNKICFLTH